MIKGFITIPIIIGIAVATFVSGAVGFWIYQDGHEFQGGAPLATSQRSVIPFADDTYYIGTTSPSNLRYIGNFTDLTVSGDCTGCGGAGTSGLWTEGVGFIYAGLTAASTTDDTVLIGSTSTTTTNKLEVWGSISGDYFVASSTSATSTFGGGMSVQFIEGVSAAEVTIATSTTGTPTVDQIQEYLDNTGSSGFFTGGAITDAGSGTVDIAAGQGFIRATADDNAPLLSFTWSASTSVAIADDTTQYIFVNDEGVINLSADEFIEAVDNIILGLATDEGGAIENVFNLGVRLEESIGQAGRFIRRIHSIIRDLRRGGLIFGQSGDANRDVTMTTGVLWWGRTEYTISAFDTSGADTFDTYTASGKEHTATSTWDNFNYDNSGTLTEMTANRWANLFFYLEPDDEVVMIYGRNQFTTQAGAEMEDVPITSLPNRVADGAILAARFTFQKSANTATLESAFEVVFTAAGITDHGDLAGLSDDDHTIYVLADGTRALTGDWNVGAFDITAVDISATNVIVSGDTINDFAGTGLIVTGNALTLDLSELGVETAIAAGDFIAMEDITDNGSQKITFANFEGDLSLGNLLGDSDDISEGGSNLYNQTHTGEVTGSVGLTIADSIAVTSWNLTTPTLTTFFGTPCTGQNFLQDIGDTGAFSCGAATGGGAASDVWATTTGQGGAGDTEIIIPQDTTQDIVFGFGASTTAPFYWDVSATTTYIGQGGSGTSSMQFNGDDDAWVLGTGDDNKAFILASSTDLATGTEIWSIAKTGTTTASNGFDLTDGCFSINDTCVGGIAGAFDTAGTGLTSSGSTVNAIGGVGITANANDLALDGTEIDAITWSDNANASNIWTNDVSGTDTTLTWGSALLTVGGGLTTTLDLIVSGGDITLGTSLIFSGGDTTSLNLIDAIDATTETTIESAIDTLANLVSIQSLTVTLADAGADAIWGWDDGASAYENLTQAEVLAIIGSATLTAEGVIEIATGAETNTGTDATRAVSPDGLDDWTGSGQITTLGTIATGVWEGTTVAVLQGGTGVTSLDDILGTANEITVGAGANTIIGGDVTISIPSTLYGGSAFEVGRDADNNFNFATDNQLTIDLNAVSSGVFTATLWAFNDTSANIDFSIDGDSVADLFFLNAGTDSVGIASTTPTSLFSVAGTTTTEGFVADVLIWAGTSTLSHGDIGTPFCADYRDSDDAGWTRVYYLDGVQVVETGQCEI